MAATASRPPPRGRGSARVTVAGGDAAARAALLERLIPGLMASGAELWVQVDASPDNALAARLRASGLIAGHRIVHRLPAKAAPLGQRRIVLADVDADDQRPDLTLMVTGADHASRLAPAALHEPDVLLLEPDADSTLLRQLRARRAGRPVMPANLDTGEGIERVLAFVAAALPLGAEPAKPPAAARKRALWT